MKNKGSLKSNSAVDLFKLIGAYLVVSIHTSIFSSYSDIFNFYFTDVFARLAVYFFFVASAYFFFRGLKFENSKIVKCKENFSKFKKYFFRITLLYVIWSFIYFLSDIPKWYSLGCLTFKNFIGFALSCITNSSHYHLWFLISLVYAVPIMYFLLHYVKLRTFAIISVVIYLVGLLYGSYSFAGMPFESLWNIFGDKFVRMRTVIFNVIPICTFAIFCDKVNLSKKVINVITMVLFLAFSAEVMILNFYLPETASSYSIFTIPAVVFIFLSVRNINISIAHSYILRRLSTIIYCMHPLVIVALSIFIDGSKLNSLLYFVIISAITTVVGLALVFLNRNVKFFAFLKYAM